MSDANEDSIIIYIANQVKRYEKLSTTALTTLH